MKKFIYKASLLGLVAATLLTSCDEDTVVYNGGTFVQFTEAVNTATLPVTEASGIVSIPVSLSTAQKSDVTITVTVTSEDAVVGENYNVITPTVTFAAGETEKNIQIEVLNDDDFNLARTLVVTIASAAPSTVTLGLSGMASTTVKNVVISNDDYDCDTDFNYWLGALSGVTTSGDAGSFSATGSGGANCDILTIKGDLANWSAPDRDEYVLTFTAEDSSGSGSVSVSTVVDDAYVYDDTTTFIIKYEATGTYDTETGEIVLDYAVNAYIGSANQGYFDQGTTVIKLAN